MPRYVYTLATLADARPRDVVLVPNCTADHAIQIWRWFTKRRKDFPEFKDGSLRIVGFEEGAWCSPKVYREAYAPSTMTCIIRKSLKA